MKLRVGIAGLGEAWESRHRPALRALSDRFEVRAVCAEVAQKAEMAAQEFQAVPVDGFRALAFRDDLDAILMLSPDWYGPLPIFAACDAGKAIYCSFALDLAPEKAKELKLRVEESGVAFMAELPRRLSPATIRLKELMATRLGRPQLLFCHERARERPPNGRRHGRRCPWGMRELMESVDWCRYVVGEEPTSVMGVRHASQRGATEDDYQMMSLDFSPPGQLGVGPVAQVSWGNYMHDDWPEAIHFRPPASLQVCCERGVAFIDLPATLIWFDEAGQHRESLERERPVGEQLLTQFHRAVTSLVRKTADLEDAYRALQIVLAARASWSEGRRETVEF